MKTPTIPIFIIEANLKKQKEILKKKKKIKQQNNQLSWTSSIKKRFQLFCRKTDAQGFAFISSSECSIREKYFWAITIVLIIVLTVILQYLAYRWNAKTPTITVISKSQYPIWNIPFPAVTICNLNLISKMKMEKLLHSLKFLNNIVIPNETIVDQLRKALYNINYHFHEVDFNQIKTLMTYNNLTINEIKTLLAPDCNKAILFCKWKGEVKLCKSLFQKINTSEGICCSFNYYAENENNFAQNMKEQIPILPQKVSGSHFKVGLSIILDTQYHDYMATYLSSYGFRLFLHDPYDYADENAEIKILNSNQETFIRLDPQQIRATSDIRELTLEKRNCYFADEFKLNFFSNYSYINCLAECRSLVLYKVCGCLPIRFANNGSIDICNFDKVPCVVNFIKQESTNINGDVNENGESKNFCGYCLPSCELNIYDMDMTTNHLNVTHSHSSHRILKNNTDSQFVVLNIFYGDLYINLYLMDVFQDWISTLAALGGIVGLLSNLNLISLFEFGFYMFLKPFCGIFGDESDDSDDDL